MNSDNLTQIDAVVHLEQAYALETKGEFDDALAQCDAAIRLVQPFLAEAHNLRGILLEELERKREALEAYRAALQVQPDFQDAVDNLHELEAELGLSSRPVTIARFGSVGEAHVARGRLEVEGIWSFVADEYAAATIGPLGAGGIRLQVQDSDVERALEILRVEGEGEQEEEGITCPRCHSWNIRVPLLGKEWRCRDCGHRWTL